MTDFMGVAEVKRRFSEVLSRVELRGESVVVRRRGRPVAVIAPPGELDLAPGEPTPRRGLAAAAGAWEEHEDIDGFIATIRAARQRAVDRAGAILE